MRLWSFLFLIWVSALFGNPTGLTVHQGNCTIQGDPHSLHLTVSDGAILHWNDFSIGKGESLSFIQPSSKAWVLNRVMGLDKSTLLGLLKSNGQVVLLNPNGILFGQGCRVEVGGLIASSLNEIDVKGTLMATSGAVALMGKQVEVSGEILTQVGRNAYMKSEANPYNLSVKKQGGHVYLWSSEETIVHSGGKIKGETVFLLSEGKTHFHGEAQVGTLEISGKKGFFHTGNIERSGMLILDPEADITISTSPTYNYDGDPLSDLCNIHIDKLIEEIEKGPVTLTTYFEGEGVGQGAIYLKGDVSHTFHSPHPLIFQSEGTGGIHIEGTLTNTGKGMIACHAPKVVVSGNLFGHAIDIQGELLCTGEIYGSTLSILGEGASVVSGKMMADGGSFSWNHGDSLTVTGKMGHLGGGAFKFDGLKRLFVEKGGHLFGTNGTTALLIDRLGEVLSIDHSLITGGGAPITLSGENALLSIEHGRLESTGSITFRLGRHCHLEQGAILSQKEIHGDIGNDLLMTQNSSIQSPSSIRLNTKGDVYLIDQSRIIGRGASLHLTESLIMEGEGQILSGAAPLFLSAGKKILLSGNQVKIEGGQTTLHAGECLNLEKRSTVSSTVGPLAVTAGEILRMDEETCLHAQGGNLNVSATEGSLYLYGGSSLLSSTHAVEVVAGKSLIMENFSHIGSSGDHGTTIVVDHLEKEGGLTMQPHSSISSGSAPLRIFTARRSLNSIQGTLNGHHYAPSVLFLNTSIEQWGTSYPTLFSSSPFTVFHKESGWIPVQGKIVSPTDYCRILVEFIGPYTAEMQRNLHPAGAYTEDSISFTDGEEPYFIRRRTHYENRMD